MKNPFNHIILFCLAVSLCACKKNDALMVDNIFRFSEKIVVDDFERSYVLNLPPNYYEEAEAFSLVIALHGGAGSAAQFESTSKLTDKANASKFIVVYPEGIQRPVIKLQTWNAGACCGYAVENNSDDVQFVSRLIDELVSKYNIDSRRVYATGHSNGGMMVYKLACELSDKIAAIAPNGCTMVTSSCDPVRPVPVLHMHSELDTNIPHQGGSGSGVGTDGIDLEAIDSVLTTWSLNNECSSASEIILDNDDYKFTKWTNCNDNVSIEYYLTKDGGHGWPGGMRDTSSADTPSTVINANDLLWEFFQRYQLP